MALDKKYRIKIEELTADIVSCSKCSGKSSLFCIGTTMNIGNDEYFFSSVRQGDHYVCGNIMITHTDDLAEIVALIDGKVDEILIDIEKKKLSCRDMDRIITVAAKKSRVGYFRGNAVTAAAFEQFFSLYCRREKLDPARKKALVVGAGHLGIKIAAILCEYAINVDLIDIDQERAEKAAAAVNVFTARASGSRASAVSPEGLSGFYALIVGATNGIEAVTADMIEKLALQGLVIDAGLRTIKKEAVSLAAGKNIPVLCLMSQPGYNGMMAGYHYSLRAVALVCRRRAEEGFFLVSGGLIGDYGDVIVDNACCPSRVIAVAKGNGLVLTGEEKEEFRERIKLVEDKYLEKKER